MKENYRLILTGQHLLILTYNLIFEEITTKNFPIHVKIYTGLPINQVISVGKRARLEFGF